MSLQAEQEDESASQSLRRGQASHVRLKEGRYCCSFESFSLTREMIECNHPGRLYQTVLPLPTRSLSPHNPPRGAKWRFNPWRQGHLFRKGVWSLKPYLVYLLQRGTVQNCPVDELSCADKEVYHVTNPHSLPAWRRRQSRRTLMCDHGQRPGSPSPGPVDSSAGQAMTSFISNCMNMTRCIAV